ncbi:DUF6192 family protein [Kitasatospora sp. NPDC096140]|uniref:DUF6192 family protein n=1 Tax=Kitasatospora sp. NPDC096140 TaxID=3155425 RepID=UPI003320B934
MSWAGEVVVGVSESVGAVSLERYDELVAEGRDLVEQMGRCQFRIGDMALEIEPMRPVGGGEHGVDEVFTVTGSLKRFAEDIGLSFHTVKTYRWTASRRPAERRQPKVAHGIHRVLGSIEDEERRFAVILDPPVHERSGSRRWTRDAASRVLGWQVASPVTTQEKVERIHDLAADDRVAVKVASDLLRRPEVAFRVMAEDDTARHMVNRAQVERAKQSAEATHAKAAEAIRAPVPLLHQVQSTMYFVDLVGACTAFVAQVGRVVPALRGHVFSPDERATVERNLSRVRGASDWVEAAVTTGNTGLDEGLAALLRER